MRKNTKFHIILFVIIAIFVALAVNFFDYLRFASHAREAIHLKINDAVVSAELASVPSQWQVGLSGRKSLGENSGMLFVFPWRRQHTFWMKEMNFPIDILFIDGTQIVDLVEYFPPPIDPSDIPTYTPHEKANRVLELTAGWITKNRVKRGDHVFILTW